jgi:hypothetical protein
MPPVHDDTLSDRHLAAFGAIVQVFARHEALMDEAAATLSGASATAVKLLTASLGFTQKCAAMLSLMRHRGVPLAQYDRVLRFTDAPRTHAALHYDIVHSIWMRTESENVIAPRWLSHGPVESVKPFHNLGQDGCIFQEWPEDIASYTLDDLNGIAQLLDRNGREFHAYLAENGLIADGRVP